MNDDGQPTGPDNDWMTTGWHEGPPKAGIVFVGMITTLLVFTALGVVVCLLGWL